MPRARIITPLPECSEQLARDLRSRGYDVEVLYPGRPPADAPGLEIALRECKAEDAGGLAAEISGQQDMCILAAPMAVDGKLQHIDMVVLNSRAQTARSLASPVGVFSLRQTWQDISATSRSWISRVQIATRTAWEEGRGRLRLIGPFFREIAYETVRLFRMAASTFTSEEGPADGVEKAGKPHSDTEWEFDLVPSLFNLFPAHPERELQAPEDHVTAESRLTRVARLIASFSWLNRRLWRVVVPSACTACALLFAVWILGPVSTPVSGAASVGGVTGSAPSPSVSNRTDPHLQADSLSHVRAARPSVAGPLQSTVARGARSEGGITKPSQRRLASPFSPVDTVVHYARPKPQSPPPPRHEIHHYSDLN